jgi:hypothetical protein
MRRLVTITLAAVVVTVKPDVEGEVRFSLLDS